MFNNLDIYLLKDRMMQNLKAQFETASQESLTPVKRKLPNTPETGRENRPGHKHGAWTFKSNRPEPEQN